MLANLTDFNWEMSLILTSEDVLEGQFNVAGVKGGRFDEREVVGAYKSSQI